MADVKAPYNFVPLNKEVFFPDWADLVSHDIPFKNGLSGKIELEITAETPIFIRKPYEEGDEYYLNKDGQKISKEFCHIKDKNGNKRYYIPGSSIRNMLRSVVEIMGFGKMKADDFTDRRFGVRDFQNKDIYTLLDQHEDIHIGYLVKENENLVIYDKGKPAKKPQREISFKFNNETITLKDVFDKESDINIAKKIKTDQNGRTKTTIKSKAKTAKYKYELTGINIDETKEENIVFTGQPAFNNLARGKKNEFLLPKLDKEKDKKVNVSKIQYEDFKFILGDYEGGKISVDWKMWKKRLNEGNAIPVFFRKDEHDNLIDFGLSFLYKMAYKNRLEKMIRNRQKEYNNPVMDLAECILGRIDNNDNNLKGRVHVKHAFSTNAKTDSREYNVVLSNPKASFYPFYINQKVKIRNNEFKISGNYQTYHDDTAFIRGRKRYPLHQLNINENPAQRDQKNVSTFLRPLKNGAIFTTELYFHNLLPEELGAIISAITFHHNDKCRHNIGLAKPFGLGQIKVDSKNVYILKNMEWKEMTDIDLTQYTKQFECVMKSFVENKYDNYSWIKSNELVELFTMASLTAKEKNNKYDYMKIYEFPAVKRDKEALPYYSDMIGYKEYPRELSTKEECQPKNYSTKSILSDKVGVLIKKIVEKQDTLRFEENGIGDFLSSCNDFGRFKEAIKEYLDIAGEFTENDILIIKNTAKSLIKKKPAKFRESHKNKIQQFLNNHHNITL